MNSQSDRSNGRNAATGTQPMDLAQQVVEGDRRAAARLITLIENDAEGLDQVLKRLYPHTGKAHVIGITGPPGGGKSTLTSGLAGEFRRRGKTVGILAIDPSSPFTGGAVLGDRVRMQDHTGDTGVFIRSMASRGALGGLARATADAVKVLDAFGCQVILVETVGAGQGEVDIARAAHTTMVVEVPGMGDGIQALKAGILEIADIFAVNKADREGAERMVLELKLLIHMNARHSPWTPPIVETVATTGKGLPELADALQDHLRYLKDSGEWDRRVWSNSLREVLEAAKQQFLGELMAELGKEELQDLMEQVTTHRLDPRSTGKALVRKFRHEGG